MQQGYPVTWLISNYMDELTIRTFIKEVKSRCWDSFKVNCVMPNDNNTGRNVLAVVFGESKHFLCKWHITHARSRKLILMSESI